MAGRYHAAKPGLRAAHYVGPVFVVIVAVIAAIASPANALRNG